MSRPRQGSPTRVEALALAEVAARPRCPQDIAALCAEPAALGVAGVDLEDGRPDGTPADPRFQSGAVTAITENVP